MGRRVRNSWLAWLLGIDGRKIHRGARVSNSSCGYSGRGRCLRGRLPAGIGLRMVTIGNCRFREWRGSVGRQPPRGNRGLDDFRSERASNKNRTAGDGMKLNSVLLRATGVAALGGLLFGFDTAVISGTTSALSQVFDLSSKSLGITVSIAIWGTVVGAMLAGFPGERYGRRDSLRGLALFFFISSPGFAFSLNWWSLVAFRFF